MLPFLIILQLLHFTRQIMGKMEGFATMFMRMPMSSAALPVQGTCVVDGKKVKLNFPFTGIEFDLPSEPQKGRNDFDFKIRAATGGTLVITVGYIKDLECFTGEAKQEENDSLALTFNFAGKDSPFSKLPVPKELKK